jgi:two-component system OmpR family sensor kinase
MDELRASEARMRQFVADASHELRTPVAATAAYAELFDHGARDHPSDLERSMTGIRNETARMGELVDDLLLLARLDEHRPLARETADLTEIVLTAVDAARAVEPERQIHLRISGVVSVEGDPARLRQVVDNLLANVRTHTPAEAACDIGLSVDGDDAVLTVADGGPGVTDAQLLRLGDRFYRVDEARTRAGGGSGLGLSIARAIVEAHGGTLTAGQNRPSGLVMTVRLPDGRLAEEMTRDESGPFWSPSPGRNTSAS